MDQVQPQVKPIKKKSRKFIKTFLILFSMIVLCFVFFGILYALKFDLNFFRLSVQGTVTDESGTPIGDVEIFLNSTLITSTNEEGEYSINGLREGRISLRLEKTGYQTVDQTIDLERNDLSYSVTVDFVLRNTEYASLSGSFIIENTDYDFNEDRIIINEQESFRINSDGTFSLNQIPSGEIDFVYTSNSFKDVIESIELNPGSNSLKPIELEPAGDVVQSVSSFVRENAVSNINVTGEAINPDMIEISNEEIRIKDLEIGRQYNIRISAAGYLTRDYTFTVVQGINRINDFRIVEAGTSVFLGSVGDNNDTLFYRSKFDGRNLVNIIGEEFEEETFYFNAQNNKLFVESDRESIQSILGGRTTAIYEYDLNTNILTRLTQNVDLLGDLYPQYLSNKVINLTAPDRRSDTRILQIMDYSGNNRIEVERTDNQIYKKMILSKDESTLAIQYENEGIFFFNLETNTKTKVSDGNSLELHAVSDNGRRIIYSKNSSSQNFTDLFMYDINSREERRLIVDEQGEDCQFLTNSDNSFIYWDEVRDQTDIYKFDIDQSASNKITNLTALDKIEGMYQQGDYTYYITNRGLYIIDILKPHSNKLVLNGDFISSYR